MKVVGVWGMVLVAVGLFGVGLPYLISAKDTPLVLAGLAILALVLLGVMFAVHHWWTRKKSVWARVTHLSLLALVLVGGVGCSKVPAGHVGVRVYLLGSYKGVEHEELGVGRYWIGFNQELYLFPTFQQNYVWTKDSKEGSPNDESFTFQTKEGMAVGADVGISYHVDPEMVGTLFQKYRRGIDEITDTFLRNHVRDAFNTHASSMEVEDVYGEGKVALMKLAYQTVRDEVAPIGLVVDELYWIGQLRLPQQVTAALNAKIEATQRAQQRENEVAEAMAEANKLAAKAEGEARAITARADAQAAANRKLAESLTPALVRYEAIQKWNGRLPQVAGAGAMPLIGMSVDDLGGAKR